VSGNGHRLSACGDAEELAFVSTPEDPTLHDLIAFVHVLFDRYKGPAH
jgi:hypothetical protein